MQHHLDCVSIHTATRKINCPPLLYLAKVIIIELNSSQITDQIQQQAIPSP